MQTQAVVLLIDNSKAERRTVSVILREAGFQVVEAGAGEQALTLADCHPDVILLNPQSPDLDSVELRCLLEAAPATSGVPVILTSGSGHDPCCLKADDYLPEGAAAQELIAKVSTWARVRQREAGLRCKNSELERSIRELQAQLKDRPGDVVDTAGVQAGPDIPAERALERSASEARARAAELAAILDAVPAVIFVAQDRECRRMTSSRTACELLRLPCGANTSKSAPEDERPVTFRAMRQGEEIPAEELPVQVAARTGQNVRDYEFSIMYEDGGARDLLGNAVPLFDDKGEPRGAVAAFIDITERKLTEMALRKSEELLRFHVENTPLAVIEWGPDFLLSRWSEGAERLFGWRADEVLGRRLDQFRWVHDDDVAHVAAVSAGLLDGSSTRSISYNRNYRKDGSVVHCEWYNSSRFDQSGKCLSILSLVLDVTEREQAVAALRESEDRFRSVLENLSEGLMLFDQQSNLIYQNPASLRIHGFDPEEEGRISHEELPATWEAWDETGRPITFEEWPVSRVFRRERFQDQVLRVRRVETGKEFYGSYNGSPLFDSAGNLIAGFITIRDITQQMCTQEALIRNEKLVSVGRMAATVAHEINNPLAAVMNAMFIARSSIDKPAAALEALDLADGELRRIAHLTRQTLGFYRESTTPAELLVSEIVDSAIDLLANKIRTKSARVSKRCCEDTKIVGIAGELRQVLSNLLANSLDAVEERGTISLRVSRTHACGREQLRVTIADDGPGIPRSIRAHIFEPFFTTKEAVGTGLGLWVSRQIVEKHRGSIRVHSSISGERRGTTFSVLLPAQAPEADSSASA